MHPGLGLAMFANALLHVCFALGLMAQTPAQDSARARAVKAQTDSLRTVTQRLTARIDSIERANVSTTPPVVTPPDTTHPPIPPDTTTPPPIPPDTARFSGPAELPRIYLNFPYPTPTRTVSVAAGGLQAALNSAQRGDELVVSGTQTGNFTVSSCGPGWITVRSAIQSSALGSRMTPTKAATVAKIVTGNTQAAVTVTGAACRWRFVGLEIAQATSVTQPNYGLVRMDGSEIVLDRLYVHGHATSNTIRCVSMNGARQQVSDSWLSECHAAGNDAQAINGINGPGPFRIVNNYLEGSGENIMFGGGDPGTSGLVPSDIEIRGNHIAKPLAWKGGSWTIKNLIELKNAARVLVEGNVLEGVWTHAQTGWAIIVKSANQAGGCRWCRSTDVTIRRNLLQQVGAGINIAPQGDQGPTDTTARRVHVFENVLDVTQSGDKRGFLLLKGVQSITLERNVLAGTGLNASTFSEGGAQCVMADNVWARGQYGVFASGAGEGTSALNKGCGSGGWTWTRQTMVGTTSGNAYPPGTTWVTSESQAPLAAQIRALVTQATAGVVVQP